MLIIEKEIKYYENTTKYKIIKYMKITYSKGR